MTYKDNSTKSMDRNKTVGNFTYSGIVRTGTKETDTIGATGRLCASRDNYGSCHMKKIQNIPFDSMN